MRDGVPATPEEPLDVLDRDSLCFACPEPDVVLHCGQPGFREGLLRLYHAAESNAAERLIKLKERLRHTPTEDFFEVLTEGLANITGAQYAFISKRILIDDENVAVEMPPIGEPGACLMGAAFYINDGQGFKKNLKNFKYHAYSCPCAYMKHDKVFIIPEGLNEFIMNNPNNLAVPGEAYLGVPLWAEGKCFAHFGVMWSLEGAARRDLSWGYLEMLCHSLEDLILERILEGTKFAKPPSPNPRPAKVVPHDAITVAQSLKPYARSLSHELRTPMQGVVGMLDIMYATVQEAVEGQKDQRLRQVFEDLKENIEVVQDSSRRAVEAADNVVHAYDMNMGVPESPESNVDDGERTDFKDKHLDNLVAGNDITLGLHGSKRRRGSVAWDGDNPAKHHASDTDWSSRSKAADIRYSDLASIASTDSSTSTIISQTIRRSPPSTPHLPTESAVVPGLRHTSLRNVIQYVITDSLKVGGRPDSAIAHQTDGGEIIEVRIRSANGQERVKRIEWFVDCNIPETILIDERDLAKMISCVFLNAVKFTEEGKISLTARLNQTSGKRYVVINVVDSGYGIPQTFLPNLFKPFSREDDSLTRQSEGLGLGLLVARGLARKLGGDLFCSRSETSGPNRGTEFEMRVPIMPGDPVSRPGTPFGSRSPSTNPRKFRERKERDTASLERSMENARIPSPPSTGSDAPEVRNIDISQSANPPLPHQLSICAPEQSPPTLRRPPFLNRRTSIKRIAFDRDLAARHPLNFLVAEDNKINRKLLVNMLQKLGYDNIREAYDGADAVQQMIEARDAGDQVDVVLMDLWMPLMDGYEAAERILQMAQGYDSRSQPTILAVTADVTDGALEQAARVGMRGFMTKPFKLLDLEKLILEYCASAEMAEVIMEDEEVIEV